jgi:hypothetical protein
MKSVRVKLYNALEFALGRENNSECKLYFTNQTDILDQLMRLELNKPIKTLVTAFIF